MTGRSPRRGWLLPALVALSLASILLPWWLGPDGPGGGGEAGNIPPSPYLDRIDARQGLEAMPAEAAPRTMPLEDFLQQLAPDRIPPQPPLPTVHLWLVELGPFAAREAAEAAREALVQGGVPAAVEALETEDGWIVLTGPETEPEAATRLLRQAESLAGASGRLRALP